MESMIEFERSHTDNAPLPIGHLYIAAGLAVLAEEDSLEQEGARKGDRAATFCLAALGLREYFLRQKR